MTTSGRTPRRSTAAMTADPARRVTSREVVRLHRERLAACEADVVRWEWATADRWPASPFLFERVGQKPGRPLARAPKTPKRGTCACGFDNQGRILVKRTYRTTGVAEEFFERHGDVVDTYY